VLLTDCYNHVVRWYNFLYYYTINIPHDFGLKNIPILDMPSMKTSSVSVLVLVLVFAVAAAVVASFSV